MPKKLPEVVGTWNNQHKCWQLTKEQEREVNADRILAPGEGGYECCPFCGTLVDADWCDVGVGMVQSGPYHCLRCGASQVGPHDDKEGRDTHAGWYLPNTPAGSTANTVSGLIVGHKTAKGAYNVGLLDEKPSKE